MDNLEIGFPENADKLLFAEDLVSYVMTHLYFNPYEGTDATPFRDFIHNGFNDVVRLTVNDIGNRLIIQNYIIYDAIDKLDPVEDLYQEIIENITAYYTTDGFNPKHFIMFCVSVAIVGAIMRNNGFEEAAEMAISAIYEFIKDVDMLNTGWDTLTMSCLPHFNAFQAINSVLTPESLSPDIDELFSGGEDDSQMSSSDKSDSAEHSESNVETPMEQNEIHVNIADALAGAINSNSFNAGSFSSLTKKDHQQPNASVEMDKKNKTESTENEMSLTYSINDIFQIKEAEKCLLSCLAILQKPSETVDSLQEDETLAICANSEAKKHLTDTEDSKVEADSATLQSTFQLQENTAHPPPVGESTILSDDDCTMAEQEENAE